MAGTVDLRQLMELRKKNPGGKLPIQQMLELARSDKEELYRDPAETPAVEDAGQPPTAKRSPEESEAAAAPPKKKVVVQTSGSDVKPKAVPATKPKPKPTPQPAEAADMDLEAEEPKKAPVVVKPKVPTPAPKPKPKPSEAAAAPKPKPKPSEAAALPKPKPKPVEVVPAPVQTKPKPSEAAAAPKPKPSEAAALPAPKPKPKLKVAEPKPKPAPEPPAEPEIGTVDKSNSKVLANTLFAGETAAESIDTFMNFPLAELNILPRVNQRATVLTMLGVLREKMIELFKDQPRAANQINAMLEAKVAMAMRRRFHGRVLARLTTVNRPPYYVAGLDVGRNTPVFADEIELADASDEEVVNIIGSAMRHWYKDNAEIGHVAKVLKEARGAVIHAPVTYNPERHGTGLLCVVSENPIQDGVDAGLSELQVALPKSVTVRYALSPQNTPLVSAMIISKLPDYVMADDVEHFLKVVFEGEDSDRIQQAGLLSATSALGIFVAMRHLARLAAAHLVLAGISPRA